MECVVEQRESDVSDDGQRPERMFRLGTSSLRLEGARPARSESWATTIQWPVVGCVSRAVFCVSCR